jgi:16S rRNA (guanine(966)-N(2))-methyltransferase RsmD
MRVITGLAKGQRLKAPKGLKTRPTTDRVKESLFNILADIPQRAKVLDLFAGSGGLGIEALSRGAEYAVFVDKSSASCQVIKDNLQSTGLQEKAAILRNDVLEVLEQLKRQGHIFTLIFCDPPYMTGLAEATLQRVNKLKVVTYGAIFVAEHSRREEMANHIGGFTLVRREQYGDTVMSFYSYQEEEKSCV